MCWARFERKISSSIHAYWIILNKILIALVAKNRRAFDFDNMLRNIFRIPQRMRRGKQSVATYKEKGVVCTLYDVKWITFHVDWRTGVLLHMKNTNVHRPPRTYRIIKVRWNNWFGLAGEKKMWKGKYFVHVIFSSPDFCLSLLLEWLYRHVIIAKGFAKLIWMYLTIHTEPNGIITDCYDVIAAPFFLINLSTHQWGKTKGRESARERER